jgi:hypothetical protein
MRRANGGQRAVGAYCCQSRSASPFLNTRTPHELLSITSSCAIVAREAFRPPFVELGARLPPKSLSRTLVGPSVEVPPPTLPSSGGMYRTKVALWRASNKASHAVVLLKNQNSSGIWALAVSLLLR